MRWVCLVLTFAASCCVTAGAQQPVPSTARAEAAAEPERVKLFNDVRGFMAPILIPLDVAPPESKCNGLKEHGDVKFSFIVDGNGRPRNVVFEKALGNNLDVFALRFMEYDRFKPAEFNGAPVASYGAMDMHLESCRAVTMDPSGRKTESLIVPTLPIQKYDPSFRAKGVNADGESEVGLTPISDSAETPTRLEKVGVDVSPPIVIHSVGAEFSDYARKKGLQGVCVVRVAVDEHGLPQDVQLDTADGNSKLLDPSLVQNAIAAVRQYRFKPAMKNGMPVPVQIRIEVDFRLYDYVH
jgi:TonB family protein